MRSCDNQTGLPAILSTSSFDGTVSVYSLTDTGDGSSGGASQAPGWLKRPAGASFGFGGQLVTFSKPPPEQQGRPIVKVQKPCTEPEFLAKADELDAAVTQNRLKEFCEAKIASSADADEAQEWRFMHILFDPDARRKLMDHIGFVS
jgi:protein transport protein SEC31